MAQRRPWGRYEFSSCGQLQQQQSRRVVQGAVRRPASSRAAQQLVRRLRGYFPRLWLQRAGRRRRAQLQQQVSQREGPAVQRRSVQRPAAAYQPYCGCAFASSAPALPRSAALQQLWHLARRRLRRLWCSCVHSRTAGAHAARPRSGGKSALKEFRPVSDGTTHVGQTLSHTRNKKFPGPAPGEGQDAPLRILPIGGLGEIGMNCMLVGNYDRYVILDAGLMFPECVTQHAASTRASTQTLALRAAALTSWACRRCFRTPPFCTSFGTRLRLSSSRTVTRTTLALCHGCALPTAAFTPLLRVSHTLFRPQIVPALDPSTPIYASSFTMALIKRRMLEFGLWNPERFKLYDIGKANRFQAGPFEVEAVRVTHSIPDCCGLFFRCDDGTIVHTGDWKIDEEPIDGEMFDRAAFEEIGREGVTLFMSDSTNVLSPGRTTSETLVANSLLKRVGDWKSGRVIATCFASNIHRLEALKAAADASGRKMVLMGMSLNVYLEAAFKNKRASFSPAQLIDAEEMDGYASNQLLIVTTGSQAEPRAMLSRAAYNGAKNLRLSQGDLLLYSAKMIPGNEKRVMKMLNAISQRGPELAVGRGENLHSSGHAHRDELTEVIRLVRPQHFLPVHGEYAFLKEHEALGRACGVRHTTVIQNGQMLGCAPLRSGAQHGRFGTLQLLGETKLQNMYNDGSNSSGTKDDLALEERVRLAHEGLVVATLRLYRSADDVAAAVAAGYKEGVRGDEPEDDFEGRRSRPRSRDGAAPPAAEVRGQGANAGPRLQGDVQLQLRALYTASGQHVVELQTTCEEALRACSAAAPAWEVERAVRKAVVACVRRLMQKKPEILCSAFDAQPQTLQEKLVLSAATRRGLVRREGEGGDEEERGEAEGGAKRGRGKTALAKPR